MPKIITIINIKSIRNIFGLKKGIFKSDEKALLNVILNTKETTEPMTAPVPLISMDSLRTISLSFFFVAPNTLMVANSLFLSLTDKVFTRLKIRRTYSCK